jgi:CHAT domain-containing protein/tetratricopeptide (TPR) repeat protein
MGGNSTRARPLQVLFLLGLVCTITCLSTMGPASCAAYEKASPSAASFAAQIEDLRQEGRYADALDVAKQLCDALRRDPAAKPWTLADGERLIVTFERASGLPADAQQELAEADRLTQILEDHYVKGEYALGASAAQRQLDIRKKYLGERHPEVARSLNDLGVLLKAQSDYGRARQMYEEALRIRRELLGPTHPDVAETVDNLAGLLRRLGDYACAESLYVEATEIRRRLFGDEHRSVALSLNNLGVFYLDQGKLAEAESLHREALAMNLKVFGHEHLQVALNLQNLAINFWRQGNLAAAEPFFRDALAMRHRLLGGDHPAVASSLSGLANLLYSQGDYAAAEDLFREALGMRRRLLGDEHRDVAWNLNDLGNTLGERGDYAGAEVFLREALEVRQRIFGSDHPEVAWSHHNLAMCLMHQGKLEEADSLFSQALAVRLKLLGKEDPDIARTTSDLSVLRMRQGDFAGAELLCRGALGMRRDVLGEQHPLVARSLQRLATCLLAQGASAAAESVLTEAAAVFEIARLRAGTGIERATFQVSPYAELAAARLLSGKTQEAWPAAERSVGRALADLLIASGRRSLSAQEAAREDSLKQALDRLESELAALREAARADTAGDMTGPLADTRTRLLAAEADWSLFQRELAAKYPVTQGQAFPLERIQAAMTDETALVGWLCVKPLGTKSTSWAYIIRSTGPVRWIRVCSGVGTADEATRGEGARRFWGTLAALSSWPFRTTAVTQITQDAMDVWAAWLGPLAPHLDGVHKLVIIPSGPMLGVPVEALVDSEGSYLGDLYEISYTPSATIYAWLRATAAEGPAVPRGKALLVGDPPFTGEHLAAMEREKETGSAIVVLAGSLPEKSTLRSALTGNEEALAQLPRLPSTREEISSIAGVIPEPTVLLGPQASEAELLRLADSGALRSFKTIHLATHALVDEDRPERSALVLSRADLPDPLEAVMAGMRIYDGLLTVKEILREWQLEADLVTLSGCQTGLGRETVGEGYIGLAHGFLQAGARSLVVSLWNVDDEATSLLMTRFYENLVGRRGGETDGRRGECMPKALALKEAKHYLRTYTDAAGNQPFRHPAYWSGFILIGDPF